MKSLMLLFVTLFVVSINMQSVRAQSFELQLPIVCGNSKDFANNLVERFEETMMFQSKSKNERGEDLTHSFWFSMKTQTWTFIVTNENRDTTCILASGDKLEFSSPNSTQT